MIYRNSKGKFISKDEWLSLQSKENKKTMNNSRRRKPTQLPEVTVTEKLKELDKSEEWQGESGTLDKSKYTEGLDPYIKEGTQVVEVGADFDVDAYKERVEAFQKQLEEYYISVVKEEVKEEEPTKTPGFFATWFKKWIF